MKNSQNTSPFASKVAEDLLALHAVQLNVQNPFIWVSGIKAPMYCDNRKVISNVAVRNRMVEVFQSLIKSKFSEVEVIAGVATGGIPMGVLIADRLNLPFVYVRQAPKEHGLKRQVEGDFKTGDKVVLIEDHISTGTSSLKAVDGLRKEGLELLGLVSIMTYGFKNAEKLFAENQVNFYSLCDLDTVLDVAMHQKQITATEKEAILTFRNAR